MSLPGTEATKVVLLGAAGTGTSFAVAARLRASWGTAVRIVGMDVNEPELVTTSLLCDRCYRVSPAASDAFYEEVIEIIESEGITTYLPIVNDEFLHAQAMRRDRRAAGVDIILPDDPGVELCRDKYLLNTWLLQLAIPTPETCLPEERTGNGPWFMKPRNAFGSRGSRRVDEQDLAAFQPSELSGLILQEVCEHPEVTVDCFCDAECGYRVTICRERLETKAGVCTKARLFRDHELERYARIIGQTLGVRGTFCFQVMKARGQWVVTDLNMRPGAGTAMSCAAGFDVLSAMFACRWRLPYEGYFRNDTVDIDLIVTRQYSEFLMHV